MIESKLATPLLLIRLSIALVLAIWTADKFVDPDHAIRVLEHFYFIKNAAKPLVTGLAVLETLLIVLFVVGRFKNITYLTVFIIHGASTVLPMANYFSPWEGANLLFFAAWPMLAACYILYVFREYDTRFNF